MPPRTDSLWRASLLRDPLLHFALLGGLIFLTYRAINGPADDGRVIRVDRVQLDELAAMFEQRHHRTPTDAELEDMLGQWIQSELLYREGRALELDQHDATLREMVISKTRALIQSRLAVPEPSEEAVARHFEAHRGAYAEPARVSISHYLVAHDEPDAARLADRIRARAERDEPAGRPVTAHRARSRDQLELLFGAEFAARAFTLTPDRWHVVPSPRGLHIVRASDLRPARQAPLPEVRARVVHDLRNETRRARYQEALERLGERYRIDVQQAPAS